LGKDTLEVNTLHHQAIKDLGRDLEPMAESPDGLIEAVKMVGKRFVCAVQWHPEYMFKTDGDSLRVFSWFVRQCG
jgi:putative glutamine amidotransferase